MKLLNTTPKKIVADEGKWIRSVDDVYFVDENGEEHVPYYSTIIFVPDVFTEEMMNELYVEEEVK